MGVWPGYSTNTEFGVQLDSLADVVFRNCAGGDGVRLGVRSLPETVGCISKLESLLGLLPAFLICCAWRLARFNVQGMAPGGSKNFVGMPTPAAAG